MDVEKKIRLRLGYRPETASVLLVGDIGDCIIDFAQLLVKTSDYFKMEVHTSDKLPLRYQQPEESDICEVDLVIMIIDSTNRKTLNTIKQSLKYLPAEVYVGRLIFIATNCSKIAEWSVEPEEINELAENCSAPVLWDSIDSDNKYLAYQILQKLKIVTHTLPNVCPAVYTVL